MVLRKLPTSGHDYICYTPTTMSKSKYKKETSYLRSSSTQKKKKRKKDFRAQDSSGKLYACMHVYIYILVNYNLYYLDREELFITWQPLYLVSFVDYSLFLWYFSLNFFIFGLFIFEQSLVSWKDRLFNVKRQPTINAKRKPTTFI